MAFSHQAPVQRLGAMLALWRNVKAQRIAIQILFAVVVIVVGYVLIDNLTSDLAQLDLEAFPFVELSGSFPFINITQDFLKQRAGFDISETSFGLEYSANDSYGDAYVIGLVNTIRVAVIGIILATVLGTVAGVARLSSNWLVSRVALVYVETFRNVPLLVQLIFWFTVVFLKLPKITEGVDIFDLVFISNRAIALPWADTTAGFGLWFLLLVVGLVVAAAVRALRIRREEETGKPSYPWWWASGTFLLIAVVTFFATGSPLDFERPQLAERSYTGGVQITPEFTALLVGLVVYTGTFIAEIVRGSIQAIPKGQTEASAALGLNTFQRLRFVILPQAMRIMVPPLTNQYLNLTKNSSLAVAVAFKDLFDIGRVTINQTGQAVPIIALVMLTYLVMSLVISLIMNIINSRLRVETR
jgi:general L-amino acid transport system permease protein